MSGRLLVVEDEALVREVLSRLLSKAGYDVIAVGDLTEARTAIDEKPPDAVLTDLRLPSGDGLEILKWLKDSPRYVVPPPVIVMTAFGTIESAVSAVKHGVYDYLTKPFDEQHLIVLLERALGHKRLQDENTALRLELQGAWSLGDFPTASPRMLPVLRMAKEVARNPSTTVLIQGESGTGKEVLARAIHAESERGSRRFVAINCAAIPDTLLESELFGYERGAFSGASHSKKGKLELADGGSVFLDEVGDMPGALQAKMLRVLQERCFERLGGLDSIQVDLRFMAATNRDLKILMEEGKFREDLFYRLGVFPIALPPLRERREDIELLVDYFLGRHAAAMRKQVRAFSPEAREAMNGYRWPGNIRELQNMVERAVILCRGEVIELEHLPFGGALGPSAGEPAPTVEGGSATFNLEAHEKQLLARALAAAAGNQSEAARLLGISRWQLRNKMDRYGLRS